MKNRIKYHTVVRAGDLVPHEMNYRTHSLAQRTALKSLLEEVGLARSVLGYEVQCIACEGGGVIDQGAHCPACSGQGKRLKLIDGHLRQSIDPEQHLTVEVLDVDDDEARKLLLTIDPLAGLAGCDEMILDRLREITEVDSEAVRQAWAAVERAQAETMASLAQVEQESKKPRKKAQQELSNTFLVLIECKDEKEQLALLKRFKKEGLSCTAKIS